VEKEVRKRIHVAGRFIYFCRLCGGDILPGQEYKGSGKKKHHHSPACGQAGSAVACEPVYIPDEVAYPEYPPARSIRRYIRSFEAVAHKEHSCWRCDTSHSAHRQMESTIFIGDEYSGEVFVGRWGWEVLRYHLSCPCDPDEEDEKEKVEDRDFEEEWRRAA